ncbi:MAG: hypothetical protein IIV45_10815, partial [Lachnospiraceae bacterium]|nr:hypothetical protein [Lachnospiraceae bacterium]
MRFSVKWRGQIFATFFSLLILCLAVLFCRERIRSEVEKQLEENLRDVALQDKARVEKEIAEKIQALQAISGDLQPMRDDKRIQYVSMLKPVTNAYGFKRVGYVQGNGKTHTTDAFHESISATEFFNKTINGENFITGIIIDSVGAQEAVNIFSVPVYSKDDSIINGVAYATYRTEKFQTLISRDSFEGKGFSCVIQDDGSFVARSKSFPAKQKFGNLFTLLTNDRDENRDAVNQIKRAFTEQESGNVSFCLGENQYAYYTPISYEIGGKQCYLLTIVPAEVLEERVVPLENYMNLLMGVFIIVFIALGVTYVYYFRKKRENLRRLAYDDPVTGGDNYAFFEEKLEKIKNPHGYLVAMDIEEFKIVNKTCGAEKGNET